MRLKEFLKSTSRKHLAQMIGKDKRYLDNLLYGAKPSPIMALRIEQATGGFVTRDELLFPELYQIPPISTKGADVKQIGE